MLPGLVPGPGHFAGLPNPITLGSSYGFVHSVIDPTTASCTFQLESDGDIGRVQGATPSDQGDWLSPKLGMGDYEARATITSGTLTSGTAGSWLNLGTTRSWNVQQSGVGEKACTFTLEIRRASDGEVLDSAPVTIQAIVN